MVIRSNGVRKSDFTAKTTVLSGASMDYFVNGVNYRIAVSDLIGEFGVTGSIEQDGAVTGTPILDDQGFVKAIRNIEPGVGIASQVSAENGLAISFNYTQDGNGAALVTQEVSGSLTFASLVSGTGINITASDDTLVFSAGADIGGVNRVLVRSASDLSGTLSSTKEYLIDGVIDMGAQEIAVPAGGLYITGYNFDVSKLISSTNSYSLFTSGSAGNIVLKDLGIEVTGTGSKVYNVTGATGNEALEINRVNYNNCTSLGTITGYRQGFELGTGRFGGTPNLILAGTWAGGYLIDDSIVRGLDSGFTGALFEAGGSFTMASRFKATMNIDLSASSSFVDFAAANFPNPSTIQILDTIITRGGVFDPTDANITPNIDQTELPSMWSGNVGMPNTFVGGSLEISAASATTISVISTFYDVAGTYDPSDLEHFDEPSNGQLRHLGNDPRSYLIKVDSSVAGTNGDTLVLKVVKWDASATSFSDVYSQTRVVNNFFTGADLAFFDFEATVDLDQNDYIKLQVSNTSSTDNVTAQVGSKMSVEKR